MQKYKDEGLYQPIYQRYEQLIKQKHEKDKYNCDIDTLFQKYITQLIYRDLGV